MTQARPPLVSIVIPAFNKWPFTFRCLLSILQQTRDVPHEVIVVDNGSSDETRAGLPQLEGVRVIRNEENRGFAKACNQGAAAATGRYVLFLNNDTEARPGWLWPMVRLLEEREEVGIVGCKLLYPDGRIQHGGVGVAYASPLPIWPFHLHHLRPAEESREVQELPAVTGACLLIRRELCQELGGFDESFINGYEDIDLCFRAGEKGWSILYTPESVLIHHESVTPGRFDHARHNERLLHQRWLGRFHGFTHDRRKERLPRPPREGRPPVTAVVPTLDSFLSIAPCAEDLLLGLGRQDELVIADGGSGDLTRDFARQLSRQWRGTVRLVCDDAGPLAALAKALHSARGRMAVIVPPLASPPPELLDVLTAEVESQGGQLVKAGAGATGNVLAGATALLRELCERDPELLAREGPRLLAEKPAAKAPVAGPAPEPVRAPVTGSAAPRFSVLVPCYNQAHFLPTALESLLAQGYGDWEALVVNDGSTDDTARVARAFSARDPRIRAFDQENGGVAAALNRGIAESRGHYLCWLSSDDLFLPDKLDLHAQLVQERPELKLMHTNFELLLEEKGVRIPSGMPVDEYIPAPDLQVLRFFEANWFNGITVCVHREVIDKVGRFDTRYRYGQDYDLWLRATSRYQAFFIDEVTSVTRIHPGQGTQLFTEAGIYDSARAALAFLDQRPFQDLFPALDLSQPEAAVRAVSATLQLLLSPTSYLFRCGYTVALVDRLRDWLANGAAAPVRELLQAQLAALLGPLGEGPAQAMLRPLCEVTAGSFTYRPHDFRALLEAQASRVERQGELRELAALRRYLALIADHSREGLLEKAS